VDAELSNFICRMSSGTYSLPYANNDYHTGQPRHSEGRNRRRAAGVLHRRRATRARLRQSSLVPLARSGDASAFADAARQTLGAFFRLYDSALAWEDTALQAAHRRLRPLQAPYTGLITVIMLLSAAFAFLIVRRHGQPGVIL